MWCAVTVGCDQREKMASMNDPRKGTAQSSLDAEGLAPEPQSAEVELNRDSDELPDEDARLDPEDASPQDWVIADRARPDMIDETVDGLDSTEESVRHHAEDRSR